METTLAPPRGRFARAFVDYNPFYLLSAMCMLAGLMSLNNSLDWSPIPVRNLLVLIVTLNVYEFMLIGLGVVLLRRGIWRDAIMLLVLEAFFLVDAGFLNSEAFTRDLGLGLLVNSCLMLLALVKVAIIFGGLRLPVLSRQYLLVSLQISLLLAIPGWLRLCWQQNHETLAPLAIYWLWWIVGILPVLYLVLLRPVAAARDRGIVMIFILLPIISILAHLCTSNWVYHVRWYHANLSPLLLGLAAAIGASERTVGSASARMRTHLLFPIAAIILAAPFPSSLMLPLESGIILTPMRLTLLGAAAVYLHGLIVHRHVYFGIAGAACLSAAGMGYSAESIGHSAGIGTRWSFTMLKRLVPRTTMQWGLVSVASSFILLAVGAAISLLRGKHAPQAEHEEII